MSGPRFNQQQAPTPSPECHLSIHRVTQDGSGRDIVEHDHRTSPHDLSIRWSSVDRNLSVTPSDSYQVQPRDNNRYEVASAATASMKNGHQPTSANTEHEHRMVLDGSDAYTLVILDCSPHPDSAGAGGGCASRSGSCDCHTKCYCQTELIIKQQQIPHNHVCQHVCQHHQPNPPGQLNQQHQSGIHQHHENYLAIEQNRSPNSIRGDNSSRGSDFRSSDNQQQEQQQRQEYSQYQEQQVTHKSSTQQNSPKQNVIQQHDQQQWKTFDSNVSRQYDPGHLQLQQLAQDEAARTADFEQKRTLQQEQRNQRDRDQMGELRQKGATKLVKRWDWNQAQFITQEVPVEQAQRPQVAPSPSPHTTTTTTTTTHSATDVWHQDIQPSRNKIPLTTATAAAATPTTTIIPYPSTSGINQIFNEQQLQQPQPWLERRIPDIESVQSDPLYRDLLFELQRLEEGVSVPKQKTIVEQETLQRPVFGQSITPEHVEVKEYENVEFVCRLIPNSDPSMKIQWTLNGKPLQESSRITNEHDFGVVRLLIKRCEAEDSGIYQCKASNSLGEAISTASLRVHAKSNIQCETLHPAGLDKIRQLENPRPIDNIEEPLIEQAPKFLTHIQDYVEKNEGESVHFECCLGPVDDPDLKTEWFFNGRPLVTGSRFHTIDDFGFIVLDIDWLFPRDTGEYVCRATNKFGTDITRTVLRVKPDKNIVLDSQLDNPMIIDKLRQLEFPNVIQETIVEEPNKPAHFVQQLKSENNRKEFNEGDNVHFEARVGPATDGNLTVEWFHNDKPLISGHRFKPSFDFGHIQLDILYVYPEDSGIYKCVARNSVGIDVSQFEISVQGKPSLILKSQLPKEMEGGVQKINEMEAMWNKPIEPEEDEAPRGKMAPEFVLKPKPYTAFEGNSARFCCRIIGFPKPRLTWVVNGQTVVTGSRYKLTYDGMYHLIIPKCQLSDAGKIEVYARNLSGECFSTTELKVKRKVDDYRGVLKNSPNPWYDEQSLKVYQRHRSSQDLTDDDDADDDDDSFLQQFHQQRLQMATEQQSVSPIANQVIGYMEPGTPDVNLLATSKSPLMEPGDLHPVVVEQQVVMAPPPSTIQRAIKVKDSIQIGPEKSFQLPDHRGGRGGSGQYQADQGSINQQDLTKTSEQKQQQHQQQRVFGVDLPRYSPKGASGSGTSDEASKRLAMNKTATTTTTAQSTQPYQQQAEYQDWLLQQHFQQQQQQLMDQQSNRSSEERSLRERQQSPGQSSLYDARLPPPSPESMVHGKEVHSHTHKQTQLERRRNKEIIREIIEKDIFEQEHKGVTKDNVMRGSSTERGSTPDSIQSSSLREEMMMAKGGSGRSSSNQYNIQQQQLQEQQEREFQQLLLQQQQQQQRQETQQSQVRFQDEQQVFVEDYMVPPEFINKIQPCQAIDGDEAQFECTFKGDPKPNISWFRETKMIRPSNMYTIITDLSNENQYKSTLIIRRVTLNSNAVYTVKAENAAGSAKSSANLVVEPHPLAENQSKMSGSGGGKAIMMDKASSERSQQGSASSQMVYQASSSMTTGARSVDQEIDSSQSDSQSNKVVKSTKTRKLRSEEMGDLIRASPEGVVVPTFLHTIHDLSSKAGELARLDARLIGTQPMEVRWLKDGQRVRADKSHKMVLEGDLYTLLILECSQRDEGFYECVACNRVGEARCGAKLTVYSDPTDFQAGAGGSKTSELITNYSTTSTSQSSSNYYTYPAQSTLQSNQSSVIDNNTNNQSEQQHQGQRKFFGQTKLQFHPLMNQYTTISSSGQLMQQEVPRLIKGLEDQQVREGKAVTLRCQISSFPIPEVHWYKQGDKPIKPSKYFRIFKDNDETYCLRILEAFPEDQGEYKCVARAPNSHANVETKAILTVIPNSPR